MMDNMQYMEAMTEKKEYEKNTYGRENIWSGDKEGKVERLKYWREFSRVFNFGYSNCELGRDFWDVNEYISEHNDWN